MHMLHLAVRSGISPVFHQSANYISNGDFDLRLRELVSLDGLLVADDTRIHMATDHESAEAVACCQW